MKTALLLMILGSMAWAEPVVVLDAGHGGSNTGAAGRAPGAWEKQVTLRVARALKQELEQKGVRVVMTREHDRYLTLRERVRRANAARPDCFISIHTNASIEHGRRGPETYVLARETAEVEARRSASRARGVEALLAELAMLDAHRVSVQLAAALQSKLAPPGPMHRAADQAVKQADYDVLSGVRAPAVLVEIGFIDHPIEGPLLLRPEIQQHIAEELAQGVVDFLSTRIPARYAAESIGEPSGARRGAPPRLCRGGCP